MASYFFLKIIEKKFNKHLVGSKKCCTFALAFGKEEKKTRGIAQLVAFLVWDQAVACSSHAAPTILKGRKGV